MWPQPALARDLCMDIGESVEAGQTSRGQHSDRLVVMLSAPGSQRTATPNPTPWPFCRSVSSPCAHTVASHIGVRVLLQFYPPPLTLSCSAQEARKQARTTSCPTSLSEEPRCQVFSRNFCPSTSTRPPEQATPAPHHSSAPIADHLLVFALPQVFLKPRRPARGLRASASRL